MKRYGIFAFIVFFEIMSWGSGRQEIVNISDYSVRLEYEMPDHGFAGPEIPYACSEILNSKTTLYVEIYKKKVLPSVTMKYLLDDGQEKVKTIIIPNNNVFIIDNETLKN